ncbi:FtsX-like permease family protein [Leifsonia sp. H3M29-4]|uniref:FtsX-like permease family protein n=1 Tax=Salinibacterium metalliresistens TaxID=3031321 RepID=UPI0023DB8CA3|nr:FtsX-like permease family protein [Salinibacterium metalliresistens]MDF1478085.1 FtsX-like permease family protein [Salinibacterium metalliresistens]
MRLLPRHFAASWRASTLVAVIVLFVVLIAALAPRALTVVTGQELHTQLAGIPPEARDLTAVGVGAAVTVPPPWGELGVGEQQQFEQLEAWHELSVDELYAPTDEALAGLREAQAPVLRDALGEADYYSRSEAFATNADEPERDAPIMLTRLAADPWIAERVELVDGAFPQRARLDRFDGPVQVMVSVETADALRWAVGEVRDRVGLPVVLSGTFVAADEDAPYWRHAPSALEPQRFDDGNSTPQITGIAYVNPLTALGSTGVRTTVWYPLEVDGLDVGDAAALAPELRSFTDQPQLIPGLGDRPGLSLGFDSAVEPALGAVLDRAATTTALLAMLASGPLGVVLAVLALGARTVVERRRAVLSLAAARGASGLQLRGAMALEGAVLGIVPAAVAVVLAAVLLPAPVTLPEIVAPAVLGLAPAVIFAAAAAPGGLRSTRVDLGSGGVGRVRWIVEALTVLLAATALVLLLRRGLTTSATTIDPLLAATPLLLCLAVCVLVLRLYPVPIGWIAARLRPRRGLVGFLGATRAMRDRSLALEAVLALVVAVAVGVFSSVLLSTIDRGIDNGALDTVGADVRVSGPVFDASTVAAASDLDGVDAVSGIDVSAPVALRVDQVRTDLRLLVVDAETLNAFRELPAGLADAQGDAVPIVLSGDVADTVGPDAELLIEGEPVVIVGSAPRSSGYGVSGPWAIVDRAFADRLAGTDYQPRLLLVDTAPSADDAAIATALTELGGPTTAVTSLAEAIDDARSAPATAGLRSALLIAVVVAAVLAALAVVLSAAIGAASRQRLLGLLRTLGVTERQSGAMVAWELVPPVIAAWIAGTMLGLGLPFIVTAAVDLTPFTGGVGQPAPAVDPLSVAAVLGAVLLAVLAAIAIAIVSARRTNPTTTLRMGAD